jgi:hypothetical protein
MDIQYPGFSIENNQAVDSMASLNLKICWILVTEFCILLFVVTNKDMASPVKGSQKENI